LLFRYFERKGSLHQALSVVKKRTGEHERTIRELLFTNGRVDVGQPLSNFEGVLTGIPRVITGVSEQEVRVGGGD
jgi:circadian clock protein KaiC